MRIPELVTRVTQVDHWSSACGTHDLAVDFASRSSELDEIIEKYRPDLKPFETVYKDIHSHPELGRLESRTAAIAASHLKKLGFQVFEKVGGHGVVGVFKNGNGKTIMCRADMDALPVLEETGLSYASKVTMKDKEGNEVPVMHACGHDTHVTMLMAASTLLISAKETWKGTLICLFQPDEEGIGGAQAMVDDGLYDKVPIPDVLLVQHVFPLPSGVVAIKEGPFMAACTAFAVTVYGKGGHGSAPEKCIDPIVMACNIIVRLQQIVSREIPTGQFGVLTVGKINAGTTHNVIPDFCEFTINIRTMDEAIRTKMITSIERIINAECEASGSPKKAILKQILSGQATICDPGVVQSLRTAFKQFGSDLWEAPTLAGSEDFSILAKDHKIPYAMWMLGCYDRVKYDEAKKNGKLDDIPGNHTSRFAPEIEPTLKRGTDAMALGVLCFFSGS
jgi:amidohydrolase